MSYLDPNTGQWKGGYPPNEAAFKATLARIRGQRMDLSDSHPPQNQTAGLDMSDEAVRSRSDALLDEMAQAGLDAGVIAPQPNDEGLGLSDADAQRAATPKADELLREMREAGLLFDGGDAA